MQSIKTLPKASTLIQKIIKGPLKEIDTWADNAISEIHVNLCKQIEELQQTLLDGGSVELNGVDDVFCSAVTVPERFIKQGAKQYLQHINSVMKLKKHFALAGYNIDVAIDTSNCTPGHSLMVTVTFKDDYSNEYIL